jgi:predicted unusual protein kinase regulating ubiquinone biosynthesis (AarF/ABC1/UbiB family)
MPEAIKRELRRFANSLVKNNTPGILESMERMGFIIEGADFEALTNVAQSLIDKYRNITPEELKSLTIDDISAEIENIDERHDAGHPGGNIGNFCAFLCPARK